MLNTMIKLDNEPAFYFPPASGRYEVSAGLSPLTRDFGNGQVDRQIFQFDLTFQKYRDNKLACRRERLSKYYQEANLTLTTKTDINTFLIEQLCREHPDKFIKHYQANTFELTCRLTGEKFGFNKNYDLTDSEQNSTEVPYTSSLDAIACQLQEDIAVIQLDNNQNHLCILHLCSPNYWGAEEKIGMNFIEAHTLVPHIDKINRRSESLLQGVMNKGPYVRFAWGLTTDTRLNHHPKASTGFTMEQWQGRRFNLNNPRLWLRVERQTLTALKNSNAILFTIRTYHYDIQQIRHEQRLDQLISAIRSMSDKSLLYKGLQHTRDDILAWLEAI